MARRSMRSAPRIAVAGFQHETNTFAPFPTTFADFEVADSWPGLLTGHAVIEETHGMNLPIAGFVAAAEAAETEIVPILWCTAEPGGRVTDDAFERITAMIEDGLAAAGRIDGLYLDLHGAMVTDSEEDAEGALILRLRRRLGRRLPMVASFDLHANLSALSALTLDALTIYRTYPHLDMAETGARLVPFLKTLLAGGRFARQHYRAPYLIPLHAQHTGSAPCDALYAGLAAFDRPGESSAEIALGFTAADTSITGVTLYAQALDPAARDTASEVLQTALAEAEDAFDTRLWAPREAVRHAMANTRPSPVILADVQDNPGAGAASDTTGLLAALVAEGAQGALLGVIDDPATAAAADAAGIGGVIECPLGGRHGLPDQRPFPGRFAVETIGPGHCAYTGDMYGGSTAVLGPTAVLRVLDIPAEVRIVVASRRSQCLDRALFEHLGLDPASARIVAVKSTVHYRADFDPIAAETLSVAAPGGFPCRLDTLPYRRLPDGIRLGPGGPAFRRPG
ncbi:MAG: M81 family metallopeptidase [Pseudomonadota bacterium]